jgi:hypothetical protein
MILNVRLLFDMENKVLDSAPKFRRYSEIKRKPSIHSEYADDIRNQYPECYSDAVVPTKCV